MLKAAWLLLFVGLVASESSVSSVVSRLLSQVKSSPSSRSHSPVILILNSKALQDSSSVEAPTFRQSSEEGGLSMLNMLLSQELQSSNPDINSKALKVSSSVEVPSFRQSAEHGKISMLNILLGQLQKSRPKPASDRYRVRPDRFQAPSNRNKPKKFPVYKSLLSLRNSLRCGARDECKDECAELPKKQEKKCEKKCEIKYECEEQKCDDDNDCDDNVSTRAPPASVETQTSCPRC